MAREVQEETDELADCIEQISLSEQRIDRGAEILERAVLNTARTLQAATLDRSPEVTMAVWLKQSWA